jgi:hypothetical protein
MVGDTAMDSTRFGVDAPNPLPGVDSLSRFNPGLHDATPSALESAGRDTKYASAAVVKWGLPEPEQMTAFLHLNCL